MLAPDSLCFSRDEISDVDTVLAPPPLLRNVVLLRCSAIGASSVPWPYRNGVSNAAICESGDSELGSIGVGHGAGGVMGLATTGDAALEDGVEA